MKSLPQSVSSIVICLFLCSLFTGKSDASVFDLFSKDIRVDEKKIATDLDGIEIRQWHISKDGPVLIEVLDEKYNDENAIIYISVKSLKFGRDYHTINGIHARLRLTYEYAAERWNLLENKVTSYTPFSGNKHPIVKELLGNPAILVSLLRNRYSRLEGFTRLWQNGKPSHDALPYLIGALDYDDEWVKERAAFLLGSIGDKNAVAPLQRVLNDSNNDVQIFAALALSELGVNVKSKAISKIYKTNPTDFVNAVQKMLDAYTVRTETRTGGEEVPVVAPPPGTDVYLLGRLWEWWPILDLEKDKKYTLHISSMDWFHKLHIPRENLSIEAIPGYAQVIEVVFKKRGTYKIVCTEYCGISHDRMTSILYVR